MTGPENTSLIAQGWGLRKGVGCTGHRTAFWGGRKAPCLDCGGGHTAICGCQNSQNCTPQEGNLINANHISNLSF